MSIRFSLSKFGLKKISQRASRSFTLIEVLIVMSIVAILLVISIPSISLMVESSRFLVTKNRLWYALSYAKTVAIERERTLVLCGSRDARHCDGMWQSQWILLDITTHEVLHRFQGVDGKITIAWQGNFKGRLGIYFNKLGETVGQQGRFRLKNHSQWAEIILIGSGRMRLSNGILQPVFT